MDAKAIIVGRGLSRFTIHFSDWPGQGERLIDRHGSRGELAVSLRDKVTAAFSRLRSVVKHKGGTERRRPRSRRRRRRSGIAWESGGIVR